MLKRLFYILLLSFLFFPLVILCNAYFWRYIYGDYTGFSGNFLEFTEVNLHDIYPAYAFWMLGILIFYNIILLWHQMLLKKELNFIFKIIAFLLITSGSYALLGGIGYFLISIEATFKFLFIFLVLSIFMVTLHYYFVDRRLLSGTILTK